MAFSAGQYVVPNRSYYKRGDQQLVIPNVSIDTRAQPTVDWEGLASVIGRVLEPIPTSTTADSTQTFNAATGQMTTVNKTERLYTVEVKLVGGNKSIGYYPESELVEYENEEVLFSVARYDTDRPADDLSAVRESVRLASQ